MNVESEDSVPGAWRPAPTVVRSVPLSGFGGAQREEATSHRGLRRVVISQGLLVAADLFAVAVGLGIVAAAAGQQIPVVSFWAFPLLVILAKLTGRYNRDEHGLRRSTLEEFPALLNLAGTNALAWSLITYVGGGAAKLSLGSAALLWASTALALPTFRSVARRAAAMTMPPERTLIVGGSASRAALASSLGTDPTARLEIVGFLPLEDERRGDRDWNAAEDRRRRTRTFDDLEATVRELEVERVFLIPTNADGETLLEAVRRTTRLGIKVSIVPRLFEVVGSAVAFDMIGGVTVLRVRQARLNGRQLATKRLIDLVGAAGCLVLLSPIMLLIALAVKLDSAGAVLFRQRRIGRDGEVFHIFKFRSMVQDAEAQRALLESQNDTTGLFKLTADPRVTRVGRFLRGTSFDELPQLFNVIRGDMSLVGPRPLIPLEDRLIEGRHRDRLHLAPGITGPWQILGPLRPPLSEMVKTDYLYAVNWSVWSDVKLMLRTFSHMVARRGL
jgi:exopolysaccharide biosynthesis polyprenyl glycosylphosphotransferase